jgi:hypothetical protein
MLRLSRSSRAASVPEDLQSVKAKASRRRDAFSGAPAIVQQVSGCNHNRQHCNRNSEAGTLIPQLRSSPIKSSIRPERLEYVATTPQTRSHLVGVDPLQPIAPDRREDQPPTWSKHKQREPKSNRYFPLPEDIFRLHGIGRAKPRTVDTRQSRRRHSAEQTEPSVYPQITTTAQLVPPAITEPHPATSTLPPTSAKSRHCLS